MLPSNWKVRVYNDAGVSVTVQVDFRGYSISSGQPSYAANGTLIASGAVASAAATSSAAQDNTTNKAIGGHFTVFATPSLAPSGNKQLLVYLIGSNDGTNYEDLQATVGEGLGTLIGVMPLAGTGALHQQYEV